MWKRCFYLNLYEDPINYSVFFKDINKVNGSTNKNVKNPISKMFFGALLVKIACSTVRTYSLRAADWKTVSKSMGSLTCPHSWQWSAGPSCSSAGKSGGTCLKKDMFSMLKDKQLMIFMYSFKLNHSQWLFSVLSIEKRKEILW